MENEDDEYREELRKTLEGICWQYFFTFTTAYPLSLKACHTIMELYYKALEPYQTTLFWVAEAFPDREGYHVHGLLKVDGQIKNVLVNGHTHYGKLWQNISDVNRTGKIQRVCIEPYNSARRAAEYLTKEITTCSMNYDFRTSTKKV